MNPRFSQAFPLLFVLLWSTGFIGARLGLPHAEPLSFLFIRYLAVIALMTLVALVSGARWPSRPSDWWHIGVAGLLAETMRRIHIEESVSTLFI